MIIRGFQKLTLLDYPGKTACTVFTGGCNMRCVYCHNSGLVLSAGDYPVIPEEEVLSFLLKRKNLIDGVCITGGEPMLQKDLPDFAGKIKEMGFAVKVDTNGSFPRQLRYMIRNSLVDYVAMDIKNCESRYLETINRPGFDIEPVKESIGILKNSGIDYEFRTTVCKNLHTEKDLIEILGMIGTDCKYFIQAFRSSDEVMEKNVEGYTPDELRNLQKKLCGINPNTKLRGI